MAIKTATITARPTKDNGAWTFNGSYDENSFNMGYSSFSADAAIFYGFNFEELRNKMQTTKVTIKGCSLAFKFKSKGGTTTLKYRLVRDFTSISSYNDLGDGALAVYEQKTDNIITVEHTETDFPKAFNWIKSNLTNFLNSFENNTFGIRFYINNVEFSDFTLSVTYEYEEAETVKIFVGTTKPSKILIGTQEVKEVYINNTKVYG